MWNAYCIHRSSKYWFYVTQYLTRIWTFIIFLERALTGNTPVVYTPFLLYFKYFSTLLLLFLNQCISIVCKCLLNYTFIPLYLTTFSFIFLINRSTSYTHIFCRHWLNYYFNIAMHHLDFDFLHRHIFHFL